MSETTTLTREDLYELVWTIPMSRVAAKYAISDVGLKKLCARHDIPTPPRGYWAQREVGRAPDRPDLPASKAKVPIQIPAARRGADDGVVRDAVALAVEKARLPENHVSVPDRLRSPSGLVGEARDLLREAAPDRVGVLELPSGCLDIRVSRPQLPRALRIADALIKSFERMAWVVSVKSDGTFVCVDDVAIAVRIEEGLATIELPPRPRIKSPYSFHYDRREMERRPSGRLTISLRETDHVWHNRQQRTWRDSEKRVIEERLTDVIVGMIRLSAAVRAERAEKERKALEEQERRRQAQAVRDEQKRLREAVAEERARVQLLLGQAARWREAESVRRFIEEARKRGSIEEMGIRGSEFVRWLSWATEQAARLDPLSPSPQSILDDAERIEQMCDGTRRVQ